MSAYHPDDMTLMNYAAGSLSIPQALAVSVHLCFCHECRDLVKNFNHLGGALLETIKPASTDDDAFDSLMASLEPHDQSDAPKVKVDMGNTDKITQHFSNPLLRYLPTSLAELPWQRQTKEISKFDLTALLNVKGFQVALQKINAGAKVPTHTHKGFEYTVILSGGFSDELGVYHEGDFIARDTSHKHSPTALQNEDCICLTVLNAPLKFTGWHRVLNPFMAWS
ncbi:transcriptional regulator [Cellvibrio mixtus]|uniref:Transcriptional regulator n=1 Tax=Cellvibrio mixtus TaxID=39650 RepID=A0A266QCD4_9GAMM|nr:ChrR family anti-sigma-E factor [Cellvibrio mixtus]OZY87001.1 transcriptional regulator [Cellvibrio mixtus]